MDLITLFILGLATWRLSHMLVWERGPWNIFVWIRELTGITHDDEYRPLVIPDNVFAGVLSCVWCCSMWIGFGWWLAFLLFPFWGMKIATAFAISSVAILVDRVVG